MLLLVSALLLLRGRPRLLVDVASRERAGVRSIVLWSDYVSPYAFVAKAWAYALEDDYEIELQWRPYTLDIASFMGSVAERDPHHWRRVRYSYMDARRFANKQGLTLEGPDQGLYARPANAGMLYAQKHGVFRAYNDLAFDRFWRRELDPENVEAVAALLAEAGAPPGFARLPGGRGRRRARSPARRGRGVRRRSACRPSSSTASCSGAATAIGLLRERLDEKGVKRRSASG